MSSISRLTVLTAALAALGLACSRQEAQLGAPIRTSAAAPIAAGNTGARTGHVAVALPTGKILIAGGRGSVAGTPLATAELYDPTTGAVAATGPLTTARAEATATLLADGRVLVAGGHGAAGAPLASAELYDPVAGTFSAAGSLTSARAGHTTTRLSSGVVLAAGGQGASAPLASVEAYNPATNLWTAAPDLAAARVNHTATLLPSGALLIAGGEGGVPSVSAERYTPGAGSAALPDMATARSKHTATLLPGGDVLIAGGGDGAGPTASAEVFDGAGFSGVGDLNAARLDASATLLPDGRVVVAGGEGASGPLDSIEVYSGTTFGPGGLLDAARTGHTATLLLDGRVLLVGGAGASSVLTLAEAVAPMGGDWSDAGTVLAGRYGHASVLLPDGRVLVTGGVNPWGGYLATTQLYDPSAGWSTAHSMASARAFHSATLLPSGLVLVAGGKGGPNNFRDTAELYDPASDTWTAAGSMTSPRSNHTATLLGNRQVLITGGETAGGELNSAELYDATTGFAVTGAMAEARSHHTATLLPEGTVLVTGGSDGTHAGLASAEVFYPPSNAFVQVGSMSVGRASHTATVLPNGNVLIVGGIDPVSGPQALAEVFISTGFVWGSAGTLVTPRGDHAAVLQPNGDLLVIGGRAGAAGGLHDVERWDAATSTFEQLRPLSNARRDFTATVLPDATVLVVGGDTVVTGNGAEVYDAYALTPAVYAPTLAGPMPIRVPGALLDLSGTGLTGVSEGSSGATTSSAVNHPIAVLEREGNEGVLYAPVTRFTTTSATVRLPGLQPGWWWVRVYAAGVPTRAWPLQVLDPFIVDPATVTVPPRGSYAFSATGASGTGYVWSIAQAGSLPGTTIDAASGVYTAGSTGDTTDIVEVEDSSHNTAQAVVTVGPGVSITPADPQVPPRGSVAFSAAGGSGAGFQWAIATNLSGGAIDAASGAYTAGASGGVTDVVQVTDSLGNIATTTVRVTTALEISPTEADTTPLGTVTFTASGGSGEGITWSVSTNASGGSIAGGVYTAGRTGSVDDVVRVTDSVGNVAEAVVHVSAGISITPPGTTVAPGAGAAFTATGGTDTGFVWALTTNGSGGTIDAATGAYVAGTANGPRGQVTDVVTVTDSLGNLASVNVTVTPGITISPANPGAHPGESITLTASGGSNAGYTWTTVTSTSGGGVTAGGVYTGGTQPGTVDVVRVTDSLGNTAEVEVVVYPEWKATGSGCTSSGGSSGGLALALMGLLLALRAGRRSSRSFRKGAAALILIGAAATAQAQEASRAFVVQRFQPSGGAYDVLGVESAQTPGHLKFSGQLWLNYASRPLVLVAPNMEDVALVKSQTGIDLALSLGLTDWAEVSVVAAGVLDQTSETNRFVPPQLAADLTSPGFSDLRLIPKARLLDWKGLRLGVSVPVTFPTGDADSYLGHDAVTFAPRALVEVDTLPWLRLLLNGGAVIREDRQLVNLTVGNAWTYGVGAEVPFMVGQQRLSAIGSLAGEIGMDDSSAQARPLEALAGLKWLHRSGLSLAAGGGPGIGEGYGTPEYRVFFQLGWTNANPKRSGYTPPPPPPPAPKEELKKEEPKKEEPKAEPTPPPPPPPVVTPPPAEEQEEELRIDTRIYFGFNKKDLKPEYQKTLAELAQVIASDPRYRHIRIEGHADDLGAEEYNQWLSEQRAQTVKKYLVKHGVDPSRIEVIGYGNRRPSEPGKTKSTRAKNRRVEFGVSSH
ncbi:MAG: kelch repeat-containing protein [Anaeromyxobacter sp.]